MTTATTTQQGRTLPTKEYAMSTMHPDRCQILPPHLLEALATNGDEEDRQRAVAALGLDAQTRTTRKLVPSPGRAPAADAATEHAGAPAVDRDIYDVKHTTDLPGTVVRKEGAPQSSDVAVNEAYDGLGDTWRLYWQIYQRNSWDGRGATLLGCVHYSTNYDNAFFDGTEMVFGDGDGKYFNRFTIAVDIVGHELTHGVTASESNLKYQGQSGALNESMSDVFGSLVKQYAQDPAPTADKADWLIGEGLFTSRVHGVALRSMKAPGTAYDDPVLGKDPQPGTMSGYVDTTDDNGGVHINSGIPNHAFYLFATAVGGYAWEKAGHVWYATAIDPALQPDADFQAFADLTAHHAQELYGEDCHRDCVQAWNGVGITVTGSTPQDGGGSGQVSHTDLTKAAGAPDAAGSPAYRVGPDGTQYVVYRGVDGHLHQLTWHPGSSD